MTSEEIEKLKQYKEQLEETFHPGTDNGCDFDELIKTRKENIAAMPDRQDGKSAAWAKPGEHRTVL